MHQREKYRNIIIRALKAAYDKEKNFNKKLYLIQTIINIKMRS